MGRVGTCSNGIFTLILIVPHLPGRKCFLVVETLKTLVQKVQKVQNSKILKIAITKLAYVYIHVCIPIYAVYVYIRVLLCRMAWKLEIPKISYSELKIEISEIPKISHSIVPYLHRALFFDCAAALAFIHA